MHRRRTKWSLRDIFVLIFNLTRNIDDVTHVRSEQGQRLQCYETYGCDVISDALVTFFVQVEMKRKLLEQFHALRSFVCQMRQWI